MSLEIQQLTEKVGYVLAKFEAADKTLQEIKQILARQEGQALPARVFSLESDVKGMTTYMAGREWIPEQVKTNASDIKALNKFMYKLAGGLALANVIVAVLIKAVVDVVWK